MEVPPDIEAKPIVSPFSMVFFHPPNRLLFREDSKLLPLFCVGSIVAFAICMIGKMSKQVRKKPGLRSRSPITMRPQGSNEAGTLKVSA